LLAADLLRYRPLSGLAAGAPPALTEALAQRHGSVTDMAKRSSGIGKHHVAHAVDCH
jgi:hypothetical protein